MGPMCGFRTRAHIRVAWATPIDLCGQGQALSDPDGHRKLTGPCSLAVPSQSRPPIGMNAARIPRLPPTRQITAASPLRRGELRRFVALWIRLFWRRAGARNDESPAWRPGLSNSLRGLGEARNSASPNPPPISKDRQLKNAVFESGGAWPIDSRRQKGRPSHRDGHGASIRLRLRGAPARPDPPPQPPTRAL